MEDVGDQESDEPSNCRGVVTWEMGKTDLNPQGVRMASQLFNAGLIKEGEMRMTPPTWQLP